MFNNQPFVRKGSMLHRVRWYRYPPPPHFCRSKSPAREVKTNCYAT
jgi:hypothetical protein